MGAGGHSVIISSDIQDFLHVHPTDEVEPNWKGGPHIYFRTSFPKPGLYKAWGQFQHKDKIIMADFVLEVFILYFGKLSTIILTLGFLCFIQCL
jgi:hypothetical protein